jgi:hypothetical protein
MLDASANTHVILVPSTRDLTSVHVVYPQAPLERDKELNFHKVSFTRLDVTNPYVLARV